MSFIHNFGESSIELILGGRHHVYLSDFQNFIIKLQDAGATLVFFCDGQLKPEKNDHWCRKHDAEFKQSYETMQTGSSGSKRFGCKSIVKSLFRMIEDFNYGEIKISTHFDCDAAIAKHAVSNKSMAVISSDSDFIIFGGNFQWWDSNTICMKSMQVKRFDRIKIRQAFGLTDEQMKYLATIAGNDFTKPIAAGSIPFPEIANFCRTITADIGMERVYQRIASELPQVQGIRELIKKSIDSYSINFEEKPASTNLDEYCSSNVMMFAFNTGQTFQYTATFLDFVNRSEHVPAEHLLDKLIVVFRKLGGIMLKSKAYENPLLNIVTKYSINENYMLKKHPPIYPESE